MIYDIKQELKVKTNRCALVPNYRDNQARRAKTNARKVSEILPNKILIMDDETYVPIDPSNIPGSKFFNFIDKEQVPIKHQIKTKEKFFEKIMVWQAIDEQGHVCEPYIINGTIDSGGYIKECLTKRLLPFVEKYHRKEDVLFWPDLSSVHYAYACQEWFEKSGIDFVPKQINPPNLPQARPIEQFWSICKQNYKKITKKPKSARGFKRIWWTVSQRVARSNGPNLMKGVRSKLKKIGREGVYALI